MKLLRYIVLLSVLSTGGQCGSYEDEYCRGIPGSIPYYLEIENLTGQTARIEFHQKEAFQIQGGDIVMGGDGEFFFNLEPGEVRIVFRGNGEDNTGNLGASSPVPHHFLYSPYLYDSAVVVVGNQREVFFQIFSCTPPPSCTPSVFEGHSPGWESSWNLFVEDRWRLIEEPRDICKRGSGDWVHRFSLRPK